MAGGLTYHRKVLSAADWIRDEETDDSVDNVPISPLTVERKRVASTDTGRERSPKKRSTKLTLKLPLRDKHK